MIVRICVCAALASGCYANNFRVSISPTVDTAGRFGVVASVGGGIGFDTSTEGATRAMLTVATVSAGFYDAKAPTGLFLVNAGLEYLELFERWAMRVGPRLGGGGSIFPNASAIHVGGRMAFLPALRVTREPSEGWKHWSLGVELSGDYIWRNGPGGNGLFGLGLTLERSVAGGNAS